VAVPEIVAPLAGAVMETVGGVVSAEVVEPYLKTPESHAPEDWRKAPAISVVNVE